ncbi:MAG: hypothetical protein LBF12_07720 [Christensenellaceae bacterium]|jgi:hypothetical protein|nr:hypothetical protein [Christensenellaceae bacterium]
MNFKIKSFILSILFALVVFIASLIAINILPAKPIARAANESFGISCLVSGATSTVTAPLHEATTNYGKPSFNSEQNYIRYNVLAISGTIVSIKWAKSDTQDGTFNFEISDLEEYTLNLYEVSESGYYKVKVTFDNNTSIVSDVTLHPTITPKLTNVSWGSTSFVYNGTPQGPTAYAFDSNMYEVDPDGNQIYYQIPLSVTGTATDASIQGENYEATVSSTDPNYAVNPSYTTKTFTITKCSVPVNWDEDMVDGKITLTYTGDPISPKATATTLQIDGSSSISVLTTPNIDVNPDGVNYISTASVNPDADAKIFRNYTLSNATQPFQISPLKIQLSWVEYSPESSLSIVYNGNRQFPTPQAFYRDVNYATLSDDINYGGTNVGTHKAKALSSSSNFVFEDSYESTEPNTISFQITPLPRIVNWYTFLDGNKNIATIFDGGVIDINLIYDGSNQISKILALIFDLSNNEINLSIRADQNRTFINAGSYDLYVGSDYLNSSNYSIDPTSLTSVRAIIQKAVPILSANSSYLFVYDGLPKSIDVTTSGDSLIKFKINNVASSNSFTYPGVYNVEIYSDESDNFLAPNSRFTTVTINAVELTTSTPNITAILELPKGIVPNATIIITDATQSNDSDYESTIVRNIDKLYKIEILDGESLIALSSPVSVRIQLEGYNNDDSVRIITKKDGKFIEQTITMKDDYFSFTLYEDGYFALTSIDGNSLLMWWGFVIGALALLIIILLIVWHKKRVKSSAF